MTMKRKYGMAPAAFRQYQKAFAAAAVPPDPRKWKRADRIGQTIGAAKASAGFHAQDGTVTEGGVVYDYCAAVDLSTYGLNAAQIKAWLHQLARYGFVAWYRYTGSFAENRHIHAIYVHARMKPALQAQVRDFLNDRNGLKGHAKETFWTAPPELDNLLRTAFLKHNPQ